LETGGEKRYNQCGSVKIRGGGKKKTTGLNPRGPQNKRGKKKGKVVTAYTLKTVTQSGIKHKKRGKKKNTTSHL